jgi:hypothetical protein
MPDHTEPEQPYKSTLPELRLPDGGFKSSLPEHLLSETSEQMRWIMHEMSRNSAATEFACKAAVMHNEHLRQLNGRTAKNEERANDIRSELASFKEEIAGAAVLSKPVTSFLYLWESRAFKAVFLAGVFLIAGVVYPLYVMEPGRSIVVWLTHWLGE